LKPHLKKDNVPVNFVQNLDSCKWQSINGHTCMYTPSDWTA